MISVSKVATKLLPLLAIPAMLALLASQVYEVAHAACSIAYDGPNNPTLTAAAGSGNFNGNIVTSLNLEGDPIDLYVADVPGSHVNVVLDNGFPGVLHEGATTNAYWDAFSGHLTNPNVNGTATFSAWDGTNYDCSGTKYRAVNHS